MKQYFIDIFKSVWTVLIGMKITFRHLFTPAVTIQYPDVKLTLPERARNRLYVNMDDCIGCLQCEMACPVDCITIETVKAGATEDLGTTSTGQKKRLYVPTFDIDIAKCCYCGLCVYPCPTECIKMTDVYEFSEYDRKNLIYNFATMTPEEVAVVKERAAQAEKEAAAKKAAAAAAAAAAKAAAPAAGAPAAPAAAKPAASTAQAGAAAKPAPTVEPKVAGVPVANPAATTAPPPAKTPAETATSPNPPDKPSAAQPEPTALGTPDTTATPKGNVPLNPGNGSPAAPSKTEQSSTSETTGGTSA